MTDELTPQEKEALKGLPRERMPAGLEARVTGAMRDHGFLEKRRRTITFTNSRVTGLLAACVALVIGAYSIGLHRGGGDPALPGVELVGKSDGGRTNEALTEALEKKEVTQETTDARIEASSDMEPARKARTEVDEVREAKPTVGSDDDRSDVLESKPKRAAAPSTPPPVTSEKTAATKFRQVEAEEEGFASIAQDVAAAPPTEAPSAKGMLSESADKSRPRRKDAGYEISNRPFTFLLNGARVVVDAPDSVRVVQDDDGRMLLIYTSDGIIRIYLTDDD